MRKYTKSDFKNLESLIEYKHDDFGNGEVEISIHDWNTSFSSYQTKDHPRLNPELADLIWHYQMQIPMNEDVVLHVFVDSKDMEKERIFEESVKKYYYQNALELKRKLKVNKMSSIWLLLTGIIFFLLFILFKVQIQNEMINTILEIACWVFTWEAVNQFLIERKKITFDMVRTVRLMRAKIVFE